MSKKKTKKRTKKAPKKKKTAGRSTLLATVEEHNKINNLKKDPKIFRGKSISEVVANKYNKGDFILDLEPIKDFFAEQRKEKIKGMFTYLAITAAISFSVGGLVGFLVSLLLK